MRKPKKSKTRWWGTYIDTIYQELVDIFYSFDDEGYIAHLVRMPTLSAFGDTPKEAMRKKDRLVRVPMKMFGNVAGCLVTGTPDIVLVRESEAIKGELTMENIKWGELVDAVEELRLAYVNATVVVKGIGNTETRYIEATKNEKNR